MQIVADVEGSDHGLFPCTIQLLTPKIQVISITSSGNSLIFSSGGVCVCVCVRARARVCVGDVCVMAKMFYFWQKIKKLFLKIN